MSAGIRMCPAERVLYLEYVCFEDVVTQLHGLLPVQLPFLPREHEGHQGVSAPV